MLENEVLLVENSEDQHEAVNAISPHVSSSKPQGDGMAGSYSSGSVKNYEGEFKTGMRHGKGVAIFADGTQYRGAWRLDKKHGVGEEVNPDHTTYHGEYSMGLRHGKGVEITVYGDEYNGEWVQGLKSGAGDYFSDGLHYVGEFLNGDRHGNCEKCVFRNGDFYSGEFKANLMEGKGCMITSWGAKYEGHWLQGKMHGQGTMLFPSGDSYTGEWAHGRRSGKGLYKSVNGASYEGEWDNGKRHGKGIFKNFQKAPSNNFSSVLPFRLVEGEVYDGSWRHGLRHGEATITKKGQIIFQGTFLNNKRDGEGRAVLKDGSVYEGGWQEGLMHGKGKIITASGQSEGVWHFGVCKQVLAGQMLVSEHSEGQLAAFEKGRSRLSGHYTEHLQDASQNEMMAQSESSIEAVAETSFSLRSLVGLDHIEEGDEAKAASYLFESGQQIGTAEHIQPDTFASGLRLPDVVNRGNGEAHPLEHDELVNMSMKHGVQMRGEFDRDGKYIPPVTKETLDEWNHLNAIFTQARAAKNASTKTDSPYSFEIRRPPGYGEGANIKQAKLRAPRKTEKEEADAGEFSYRRWRMERGDSSHGASQRNTPDRQEWK